MSDAEVGDRAVVPGRNRVRRYRWRVALTAVTLVMAAFSAHDPLVAVFTVIPVVIWCWGSARTGIVVGSILLVLAAWILLPRALALSRRWMPSVFEVCVFLPILTAVIMRPRGRLAAIGLSAFAVACVAAAASAAIVGALLRTGLAWRLATDVPNDRSLHVRPTPRVGGWGVSPVAAVALLALPSLRWIGVAVLFLAAVSQIDDRRGLPARVRFAAHVVAVAGLLASYSATLPLWAMCAVALALIWLVNLYNFMDGADGLAGGMAVFGFAGYAVAALVQMRGGQLPLSCAAVAGAAAGFLALNFHPARVFLGDAGSIPLGFLAGALGWVGWRAEVWPVWFPVMAFAPFIADASVTLLRRLMRGEKFWHAHREHYYQRMVRYGLGHRRVALYWYVVMGGGIIVAVYALRLPAARQWAAVVAWFAALVCMGIAVDARWRRFQRTVPQSSEL